MVLGVWHTRCGDASEGIAVLFLDHHPGFYCAVMVGLYRIALIDGNEPKWR
jgi:hypothetical protein